MVVDNYLESLGMPVSISSPFFMQHPRYMPELHEKCKNNLNHIAPIYMTQTQDLSTNHTSKLQSKSYRLTFHD